MVSYWSTTYDYDQRIDRSNGCIYWKINKRIAYFILKLCDVLYSKWKCQLIEEQTLQLLEMKSERN